MNIRKAVAVAAVLALGIVSTASAQINMSAGAYAGFASDFGGGPMGVNASVSMMGMNAEMDISAPWMGFSFGGFFDLTYAEIGVGLTLASGTAKFEESATGEGSYSFESDYSAMALDLSLMGKYPIDLGGFVISPTAGINYSLVLSAEDEDGDEIEDAGDMSKLWVKFGAGADIPVNDAIFIRASLLYGIGFASKAQNDMVDDLKEDMGGIGDVTATLSHGLDVRVGVGFRF